MTNPIAYSHHPFVSVLVPIYNEERFVGPCLKALRAQDYPPDRYEVIVIDGGSQDSSVDVVKEVAHGWPNLVLAFNTERTIPKSLNLGLSLSRGDVVMRVDGHTIVAPDYMSTSIRHSTETGADNVGGRMRPVGIGFVGRSVAVAMSTPFGGPGKYHYSEQRQWVDTVYLGAYRREALVKLGGWDPGLPVAEDYDLNFRLRRTGGTVLLSPDIRSDYHCRDSWRALIVQQFRYGRYKAWVLRKHGRLSSLRHFPPPLFAATVLLAPLAGWFVPGLWALWLLTVGSYAVCSLGFSVAAAAENGWSYLFSLPGVYLAMHLSNGWGFWAGCADVIRGRAVPSCRASRGEARF